MSETHAEQPEWLAAWQDDPRSRLPQQVGNPNWRRGGPSPNPKGRPPGQSKSSKLIQRMLDDAGGILDAMIARALEGDTGAAALILSRVLPALRSQSEKVAFDFDPAASVSAQIEQVLAACASGVCSVDVGKQIIDAIGTLANARLAEEVEARLAALEAKAA